MGSDYCWQTIDHYNEDGLPVDNCGYILNPNSINGNAAKDLTSPYGCLTFAVGVDLDEEEYGDEQNFVCFDWAPYPEPNDNGLIILHAVLNCDTGSFIEKFAYRIVPFNVAVQEAMEITEAAIDWCQSEGEDIDIEGWNQDPFYWVRDIARYTGAHPELELKRIEPDWLINPLGEFAVDFPNVTYGYVDYSKFI